MLLFFFPNTLTHLFFLLIKKKKRKKGVLLFSSSSWRTSFVYAHTFRFLGFEKICYVEFIPSLSLSTHFLP